MKRMNVKYCMNNDRNFARLYKLTLKICDRTEFPEGTFTDSGNAWLELTESWNDLFTCGSAGIFMDAAHRIMWSIPYVNSVREYTDVVKIVVQELLADGEAFAVWDSYTPFNIAMTIIGSDMNPCANDTDGWCFSIEHYHYLRDRLIWKIRYSKSAYISKYSYFEVEIKAYEQAIMKLIPIAKSWDEDYWCNENHIHDEIVKAHGMALTDDFENYDLLLFTLMVPYVYGENYELQEAWCASGITHISDSMAKAIWPLNTEEKIVNIFDIALKNAGVKNMFTIYPLQARNLKPLGDFKRGYLDHNWIYEQMKMLVYNDSIDPILKDRARTLFFNMKFAM